MYNKLDPESFLSRSSFSLPFEFPAFPAWPLQHKIAYTHMMSPSFSLVCIKAQLLWSLVVTARRRRGETRGVFRPSGGSSCAIRVLPPSRTIGDEPRRRVDMCRPPTLPIIWKEARYGIKGGIISWRCCLWFWFGFRSTNAMKGKCTLLHMEMRLR